MEMQTYQVEDFCKTFHISRAKLYQLWAEGTGPQTFRVGRKILISVRAAQAWVESAEARQAGK